MNKAQALNALLADLLHSSGDVEACAIASEDGLIIASALPQGMEETRIAAMSAAMLAMGSRTVHELQRGNLTQILVKGDDGYVVLMQAGNHAVLIALARQGAKLGLIFYDLARTAQSIGEILN